MNSFVQITFLFKNGMIQFEELEYFLHNKHAFVIQNERVNREEEFLKNIFIGNELCLIDKSMIEKG